MTTRRLVVIGGGIAGLAAAWAAREADQDLEIVVLERQGEVGGKARTIVRGEWMVEAGPTGFLSGTPELDRLIGACGLAESVRPADPAAARRFIQIRGRMRRVAPNPISLVGAGLLSAAGCARMLAEVVIPARRNQPDESVWDFAARRLGTEVADRLISPMTLGVFAGDAHRLSLSAAFPRMAALEREHGSLIRGTIARALHRRRGTKPAALHSFDRGMQTLPRSLAARGAFQVRCERRGPEADADRIGLERGHCRAGGGDDGGRHRRRGTARGECRAAAQPSSGARDRTRRHLLSAGRSGGPRLWTR